METKNLTLVLSKVPKPLWYVLAGLVALAAAKFGIPIEIPDF